MVDDLWDTHEENPSWSTRKLAEEMALPWKAVDNQLYRLKCSRQEHWLDHTRIGFFDIETSDLKSNVGYMFCWGLLMTDGTVYSDHITRQEIMGPTLEPDRRIVASCVKALNKNVDTVFTYNGRRFDKKFVLNRALLHGLPFPAYGQVFHQDLYMACRELFATTNKRMGTISDFLGLAPKDHYDLPTWNRARRGDTTALDSIYKHNVADLYTTQDLLIAIGPYMKWTRRTL